MSDEKVLSAMEVFAKELRDERDAALKGLPDAMGNEPDPAFLQWATASGQDGAAMWATLKTATDARRRDSLALAKVLDLSATLIDTAPRDLEEWSIRRNSKSIMVSVAGVTRGYSTAPEKTVGDNEQAPDGEHKPMNDNIGFQGGSGPNIRVTATKRVEDARFVGDTYTRQDKVPALLRLLVDAGLYKPEDVTDPKVIHNHVNKAKNYFGWVRVD